MSISKKLKTIISNPIDSAKAYSEGKKNFDNPIAEVEVLAKRRVEWSKDFLVAEPNEMFQVVDNRIPELSEKMHSQCGCTAAYLFRQSIDILEEWEE